MLYYHRKIIVLFILFIVMIGCKKIVQLNTSSNQLGAANVFKQDGTATQAVTTIYAKMFSEGASPYLVALLTGLQADEITNPFTPPAKEYYLNAIDPLSNLYCTTYWNRAYHYIYLANAVLEGCQQSVTLSAEVKKQLMAEALFIRAYQYFYLVNLYGSIPVALTTDYEENKALSPVSTELVYDQILSDLKIAQLNLNIAYVGKDSWPGTIERVRPNKAAANALLARVYLYRGKWVDAEDYASLLIDNVAEYSLVPPDETFLKGSIETIWALRPSFPNHSNINTVDGSEFILTNSPVSSGRPFLNRELVASFEEGDLRMTRWIGRYVDGSNGDSFIYCYPYKYKVKFDSDLKEYTVILRLAEQYLIRAEARANQGRYHAALEDVNVIRKRAGLAPLSSQNITVDLPGLMHVIMQERQREFFAEMGHRWFDLNRTGSCDSVMNRIAVIKNSSWNTHMKLWPVPAAEIAMNPRLRPSAGYHY